MHDKRHLCVIFLVDALPPKKLVFLKRSPVKSFAPNMYTGLGGKAEANESPIACAYRELEEESGLTNVNLIPFAQCIVNDAAILDYYVGLYSEEEVPDCNEGILSWVNVDNMFDRPIITTTEAVLHEWQKREFSTDKPWRLHANRADFEDADSEVVLEKIEEGLL